jgi:flagellar motor switch protein FliM
MPAQEAIMAIGLEVRIGEISGMLSLAIPSVVIKMMRQKTDALETLDVPQDPALTAQILGRIRPGLVRLDALLTGARVPVGDLAALEVGDVLTLQQPEQTPVVLRVNGKPKCVGQVIGRDGKRAFRVDGMIKAKK